MNKHSVLNEEKFRLWLTSLAKDDLVAGSVGRNSMSPLAMYLEDEGYRKIVFEGKSITYEKDGRTYKQELPRWANEFLDAIQSKMAVGKTMTIQFYVSAEECLRAMDRKKNA